MPGFPLAAIGAGLGEWAKNYQQQQLLQQNQQDQQLRRQLQMMQLRELLQSKQSARSAADAAAGYLTGGGGGISPVNPTGGVGVPMSQAAPAALGFDAAFNGPSSQPSRPPLQPGVGGAIQNRGMEEVRNFAPLPSLSNPSAPPINWRPDYPTGAALDTGGPGAPSGNTTPVPGQYNSQPSGITGRTPPASVQGAAATPAAPAAGGIGAPPPEFDPSTVAAAIKRSHPEISNQDLVAAVELVGKDLKDKYKGAYDRWKTQAELYYRGRSADTADRAQRETERYHGVEADLAGQRIAGDAAGRAETGRHNLAGEALGQQQLGETTRYHGVEADLAGQRIGQAGQAQAETARHNVANEQLGQGQLAETTRSHNLTAAGRDRAFDLQKNKAQAKTGAEVAELKTLADQARQLYAAVEQNPTLVGAKGVGARVLGGIGEQLGVVKEDPAAAELKSQIGLLQARLQKPLLGARYFSGRAQEQISQLVPALGRLDNPTAVKSALRNLADQLEGKAGEIEATTKGVYGDANALSDDAVREGLKQMGIEPAH